MKLKSFISLLTGIVCSQSFSLTAQIKQGMVFYEETRISLTPERRKQIEEQMPDANIREMILKKLEANAKSSMILAFSQEMSSYKVFEGQGNDPRVKSLGEGTGKSYFKDLSKKTYLSQADILGKAFLISDVLRKIDWKLTGEGKKIGKMNCQKATATVGKYEVEAWFALEIPVSSGPADYWGLPGLIIELKEKGGKTFTFKEFKEEVPTEGELAMPTEGKKVSQREYDEILAQKTKELTGGTDATGSGGVKILKMN